MLSVAILSGGLATRMRPITETIPKALIEVAGRPFVCHQLDYLRHQGITKVVMCTGYLGEQIEAIVGDGREFGLDVKYSVDGPTLLGTGGALKRALPLLEDAFFVLYGDSYLPCDFRAVKEAFHRSGKSALMTVMRNENQWDKSNVIFRDGRIVLYSKRDPRPEMAHIDYGLGIVSSTVLNGYPDAKPFDLADVYQALSIADRLAGFEVRERFYEIGSLKGLQETESYLSKEVLI